MQESPTGLRYFPTLVFVCLMFFGLYRGSGAGCFWLMDLAQLSVVFCWVGWGIEVTADGERGGGGGGVRLDRRPLSHRSGPMELLHVGLQNRNPKP